MKNEKVYAYIGRFRVPHNGHLETMKRALGKCDHLVVIVGSHEQARDPKNPFTFNEVKAVIDEMLECVINDYKSKGTDKKLSIVPVHDYMYSNTKWLSEVQSVVSSVTKSKDITLTGYEKDDSSFYLKFFPQWDQDFLQASVGDINATDVRTAFFERGEILKDVLPQASVKFLEAFKQNKAQLYESLKSEHLFIKEYREKFKTLPYEIPFLTGDAVVTCAGHILLIERGQLPGKGLWALPGGFFQNSDVDQVDTAVRELREETRLKVPAAVLRGSVRRSDDFTHPNRSLRWRILTKASYIVLNDTTLPKVKGSDDAKKAMWVPINEVIENRDKFFEDHLSIIDAFLGIL